MTIICFSFWETDLLLGLRPMEPAGGLPSSRLPRLSNSKISFKISWSKWRVGFEKERHFVVGKEERRSDRSTPTSRCHTHFPSGLRQMRVLCSKLRHCRSLSFKIAGFQVLMYGTKKTRQKLRFVFLLLSEWRDVRSQKSPQKYEMKYDLY